jgi:ribA/ribD-fused uncharacterized protein
MSSRNIKRTSVPVSIRNRMEKIYTYIKYCQRLEDAYRTKHEEVRTLNEYLKRIQRVLPANVSDNCPEVNDIITYIQGLPDIPDTDDLNETLRRMIDEQKRWREENDKNYNLINRKIDTLNESRDVIVTDNSLTTKKSTYTKTMVSGDIKPLMLRNKQVIPFHLADDKFKKYGGGFLSSYFTLKNQVSIELDMDGKKETFKFKGVCGAFLAAKSKYIKDQKKRREYVNLLLKTIDYKKIEAIKKKYLPTIKKDPNYTLNWHRDRYQIMKDITLQKFKKNPELNTKLKNTGDTYLLEHPNNNTNLYWGDSVSDNGKIEGMNMMGKLLMEIREELHGIKSNFVRISVPEMKRELNSRGHNLNVNSSNSNKLTNKKTNKKFKARNTKKRVFGDK